MIAKSYVLGMVRRPLTTYDAEWQLVCMLCVELPTHRERPGAETVDLGDGKTRRPLHLHLRPTRAGATACRSRPRTCLQLTRSGTDPKSGVADAELYRRITQIEVKDAKTFTLDM